MAFAPGHPYSSLGGRRSVDVRGVRGNSEWGKAMLRRRGWLTMQRAYPELSKQWRAKGIAMAHGQTPPEVPEVPADVMNPYSVKVREQRRLKKRQQDHDAKGNGR